MRTRLRRSVGQQVTPIGEGVFPWETVATESFSIPVNYATGVAVPEGTVFLSAADVDGPYRDLQDVIDALPQVIYEATITIELAAGVHRPLSTGTSSGITNTAWALRGFRFMNGGSLTIQGSTEYTTIHSAETITAHTDFSAGVSWPSVTVGGTPWTGLDLTGLYAVTSDGSVSIIRSNTANVLQLQASLETSPTDSTTTVTIARPSTILRNSLNDSTPAIDWFSFYIKSVGNPEKSFLSRITFQDIQFDTFGSSGDAFYMDRPTGALNVFIVRCLVDCDYQLAEGASSVNSGFMALSFPRESVYIILRNSGTRFTGATLFPDSPVSMYGGDEAPSALYIQNCVFYGHEDPLKFISSAGSDILDIQGLYLKNVGTASRYSLLIDGAIQMRIGGAFTGHKNGISDTAGGGILLKSGASTNSIFDMFDFEFDNVAKNCLDIGDFVTLNNTGTSLGLVDGGSNGAFGIETQGSFSKIVLNANTDVSGSSGDLNLDGTTTTYATAVSNSPNVTTLVNVLIKDT